MSLHTTTEGIVLGCVSNSYRAFIKNRCCRVLKWENVLDSLGIERTGAILSYNILCKFNLRYSRMSQVSFITSSTLAILLVTNQRMLEGG